MPMIKGDRSQIAESRFLAPANSGTWMIGERWPNAVWVDTASPIAIVYPDDSVEVFGGLIAGTWHNFPPFKRINSTGTTVTSLHIGVTY